MHRIQLVARIVAAVIVLAAVLPSGAAVVAQSPVVQPPPDRPCPLGKALRAGGATLIRPAPAMQPGPIANLSGSFEARRVDDPCDPPIEAGPFMLVGAGKLTARIVGTPPVPAVWSLHNYNTSLHLVYEPYFHGNFGPSGEIISLVGEQGDSDLSKSVAWLMPGRITVAIGAPNGGGPLSGSCFGQSFQATIEISETYPASPLLTGDIIYAGDKIQTGAAASVVQTPAGGVQLIAPGSAVGFEAVADAAPRLDVPEFQRDLGARLDELARQGLPMPASYWTNPGEHLSGYREGTRQELWDLIKGITDPCEASIQAKTFLDLHEGEWAMGKTVLAADEVVKGFLLPDEWDALQLLALGIAPPLAPVFAAAGKVGDWQTVVNTGMDELKRRTAAGNRRIVYDAVSKSKGWDRPRLDAHLTDLRGRIPGLESQVADLKERLGRQIAGLETDLARGGCWPPTLFNEERCRAAWDGYASQRRGLEATALDEAGAPLAEIAAVRTELRALDLYRAPLADGQCDRLKTPPRPVFRQACAGATRLERGSLRQTGPGSVLLGDRVISAAGTEFVAEQTEAGARVRVVEGTVSVRGAGEELALSSGQQIDWPAGTVSAWDVATDDGGLVEGLPLRDVATDETGQPYGERRAAFADNRVPEGWLWQDPGRDAKVETVDLGASGFSSPTGIRITTPNGNDLWDATSSAPRLMHQVTGDFALEGELFQQSAGKDIAITQFVAYSPGSYLGFLAAQASRDAENAQFLIVGGDLLRAAGKEALGVPLRDWSFPTAWQDGPPIPDHPIRVRMTRRGDEWRTYWSADAGRSWNASSRKTVVAPDTLWIGWVFRRVARDGLADQPAINTLGDVTLVTAPRGSLPAPAWDTDGAAGAVAVDEAAGEVHLTLNGARPSAQVAAYRNAPLDGDFDAAFSVEAGPWAPPAHDADRGYMLVASTADGRNLAYVRALQSADGGSLWDTDVRVGVSRGRQALQRGPAAQLPDAHLRLVRRGDWYSAYGWSEGEWLPIGQPRQGYTGTVYLEIGALGRNLQTAEPVTATARLERIAEGRAIDAEPWRPPDGSLTQPATLPGSVTVSDGLKAALLQAPFALGSLFVGADGAPLVFSAQDGRQKLLRIDASGQASIALDADLLTGAHHKTGLALDGGKLLVAVVYPGPPAPLYGLYAVEPGRPPRKWTLGQDYGGLGDVVLAPGGGYFFCDFARNNVYRLAGEGQAEEPLITGGDLLSGPWDLAWDPDEAALYVLNVTGGGDLAGAAAVGVYRVADGRAAPVLTRPAAEGNYGGIAWNPGGVLPAGLYVTDAAAGTVVRLEHDGRTTPVVTGLTKPGGLAFQPGSGALWVVCDGGQLLVVGADTPAAPAAAPPNAGSAQGGGRLGSPTPLAKSGVSVN